MADKKDLVLQKQKGAADVAVAGMNNLAELFHHVLGHPASGAMIGLALNQWAYKSGLYDPREIDVGEPIHHPEEFYIAFHHYMVWLPETYERQQFWIYPPGAMLPVQEYVAPLVSEISQGQFYHYPGHSITRLQWTPVEKETEVVVWSRVTEGMFMEDPSLLRQERVVTRPAWIEQPRGVLVMGERTWGFHTDGGFHLDLGAPVTPYLVSGADAVKKKEEVASNLATAIGAFIIAASTLYAISPKREQGLTGAGGGQGLAGALEAIK